MYSTYQNKAKNVGFFTPISWPFNSQRDFIQIEEDQIHMWICRWRRLPQNPMEMMVALLLVSSAGEKGVGGQKYVIYTNLLYFLAWVRSVLAKNLMALIFDKPSCLSLQIWFLSCFFFFFLIWLLKFWQFVPPLRDDSYLFMG